MKATKQTIPGHGKCIVLFDRGEYALLYRCFDAFTLWYTGQTDLENLNGNIGTSQFADLRTILSDMEDAQLAEIYNCVVGYDPFKENKPRVARALVIDYMMLPEAQTEIF